MAAARSGEGNLGDEVVTDASWLIPDLAVDVTLRAREGNLPQARALLDVIESNWAETSIDYRLKREPEVVIARRALALAEGRVDELSADSFSLIAAVNALRPTGGIVYFRGAETLAGFWEAHGDLEQARHALEDAWRQRARSHTWLTGAGGTYLAFAQSEWLRVSWKLAVINRKLGRLAEARAIEDELRGLLAYADADMWLIRQLGALERP